MEILYKKDGINNYMILKDCKDLDEDYKMKMLINNKIDGILQMRIKVIDNENQLYYDITSKNSASSIFVKRKIQAADIEKIITCLSNVAKICKEYLLDFNNIMMDMDMIFYDEKDERYFFCYNPFNKEKMSDGLKNLFTKILERLNHKDSESVVLGYGLQQMILNENISITEMVDFVRANIEKRNIEKKKNQIIDNKELQEYDLEIDVNEKKEKKKNKKIKIERKRWWQFWKKKKPKGEEELLELRLKEKEITSFEKQNHSLENIEENSSNDIDTLDCEEATILLSSNIQTTGIILRSTDLDNPVTIIPNGYPCIIGKSKRSSDCKLEEQFISRVHARLYQEDEGYYIEDLNSSNGTFINGERLKAHVQNLLEIGDTILLANMEFIVE